MLLECCKCAPVVGEEAAGGVHHGHAEAAVARHDVALELRAAAAPADHPRLRPHRAPSRSQGDVRVLRAREARAAQAAPGPGCHNYCRTGLKARPPWERGRGCACTCMTGALMCIRVFSGCVCIHCGDGGRGGGGGLPGCSGSQCTGSRWVSRCRTPSARSPPATTAQPPKSGRGGSLGLQGAGGWGTRPKINGAAVD